MRHLFLFLLHLIFAGGRKSERCNRRSETVSERFMGYGASIKYKYADPQKAKDGVLALAK
jgi:hypothetical protein